MRKISKISKKILTILCLLVVVAFASYQLLQLNIPALDFLKDKNPTISNYMISDDFSSFHSRGTSIIYTPLSEISPQIVRAILLSEDDLFFEHHGFNWQELERSLKQNYKQKRFARGGSTITQQLARNLFLSKDKSIIRKVREWILTYKLESLLTKKRILELYLNFAEFGPSIYGIDAATRYHFGTTPKHVTSNQAAILAATLPNPKFYGKKPYPNATYKRQKRILSRLHRYGMNLPDGLFAQGKELPKMAKKPIKNTIHNTPQRPVDHSVPNVYGTVHVEEQPEDSLDFDSETIDPDAEFPSEVFVDD